MAIVLRGYQEPVVDGLRAGFIDKHIRQIMSAATGSGKSIIMMYLVKAASEKGSRVLFIVERRNLAEQFSAHLDREGIDHGIYMAGHWRFRPQSLVQIASAQTLERMESWPAFDVVFIDEIHACMRKSIVTMFESRPNMKVVGATATPFNPLLGKYFTNVVSAPPMAELVGLGNLVPFRVFVAHEINTEGVTVVAGEWQKDELESRGRQITGDIVVDYLRLSNEVFGRKSKAICFSCGIAHGEELSAQFQESGINAIQLASGVDEDYKTEVLRDFARADSSIDILISVDMLSRGFDQTDIEHVILARPLKKSFSQHVQMIGRGARSHEGKALCVVQDHTNNWLRFAEQWEDFYRNGVRELSDAPDAKPKKEPTKQEKEAAKCPKCGAIWTGDTCLHCGHVRVRVSNVATVPGQMVELTSTAKKETYSSEYKKAFYQSLIAVLQDQGKNINRAYFIYKERFNIAPPWEKVAGTPTVEAKNYITAANIAYANALKRAA